MDAIRTIIFFIPLIFHCECTKWLCSNSTGSSSGMSKGGSQVGCGTDSMQASNESYFYSHIGIIIGAVLLAAMMIALVGVILYLKHWRKNIYPAMKGRKNNKPDNQKEKPPGSDVLNIGYEQGSLGNLHIDGERLKQMYITKNNKDSNAKGTNNKGRSTPKGTDIFLSNFEMSTFGAKNNPEATHSENVIIDVDEFDHKKDRNNGLGSYLNKFEKSEIARQILKNSIKRFKATSRKIRNFEII